MQDRKPELHHKVVTWKLFCSIFLHIAKNKQTAESTNFTTFKPMFIIADEQGGYFFFFVSVPFTKNSGKMIRFQN